MSLPMPLLDCSLVGEAFAEAPPSDRASPVLVLGVGNLLMGDEGVGIHALRALETLPAIPGVRLLDGGTGGANLLSEFDGVDEVVLLDATFDRRPAGTVTYQRPMGALELPRGLGAHDFGLKDLFVAAELIGTLPKLHLYTISIAFARPMCTELSSHVKEAVSRLVAEVHRHSARLAKAAGKAETCALPA
jgi:hydrogenase maturation protease